MVAASASNVPSDAQVVLRRDHRVLDEWAVDIDDLHRDCGVPITSARRWLRCWYDAFPDRAPLIIAVRSDAGRLDAMACLATGRRGAVVRRVVAAGHDASDYTRFAARDAHAAERLAAAIRDALDELGAAWSFRVRHLFVDDPLIEVVRNTLPNVLLVPTAPSFAVRLGTDRTAEAVVSKNLRRNIRRNLKQLEEAGISVERGTTRDADSIERVLPEIREIHRRRDDDVGRVNRLVDPRFERFFEQVLLAHARDDMLEMTTVRADGTLIAYDLAFVDGRARRVWNGRFHPAYGDYSPGKLSLTAALDAALADPDCDEFDLMIGDEPYKHSFRPERREMVDLHAASSRPLRAVLELPRHAKDAARPLLRHPVLYRSWQRVKVHRRRVGSNTG